ncbi:uncharacterized protein TNCV_4473041 [Trichonephila clavipes]|uniref:Mos1 transposase HTH domain-containing protein n=1 Tax=Trichonephila clavipes TaxID=2585209 RepID=A0A8X6SDR8_TRICX|nr:uncharacterized protein TNCV_4473041 [Trichonephila clavipes]
MRKTAFGDEAMSRARVFEWFRQFKECRLSENSDPRSGCPSTSRNENKIAQVKDVVHSDHCLTQFQRLATSSDLFQSASDDPEFMKLIITGDESWVYGYDPKAKQQSSQWKTPYSPRPKKAGQVVLQQVFEIKTKTRLTEMLHRIPDVLEDSSRQPWVDGAKEGFVNTYPSQSRNLQTFY